MANNRLHSLQSVAEEYCTCRLCGNAFTLPLVLPCFHSFCTNCLEDYVSKQTADKRQNSFECPTCLLPTAIRQGSGRRMYTEGFKGDTFATKLTEVIGAFKDDKSCDICKRREITVPASDWCMDCFDAVCENCTKAHLCGKATCDHIVISLEELRKLSLENIMKRTISQKCAKHETDVIKLYCLDCKEPVCVQCLASQHRKCETCVPIAEALESVAEDVADVMVKLRSLNIEANGDMTTYVTSADILEDSMKKAEADIRSLAADLRRRIDENEQALLERLHSVGTQLHEKVGDFRNVPGSREDDMKSLTTAHERMDALMKYGSDMEVLDVYNVVKEKLSRVDESNSSMTNSIDDEVRLKVKFDVDESVKVFSRDFETMGEIRAEDCNSDDGLSAWGVTVTSRDEIIVVDCRNRRVQKFAGTGDLTDHIQISGEPRDVTIFGNDDVAITIMKKQIFIVTLTSTMVLKRRITTQKQYDGIAYSQSTDCFLVSSLEDNCVDVISTQGDVTKTFSVSGNSDKSIFGIPRYVAFTKEEHYVISDAAHNSVTCITQDGRLLFSYSPSGSNELKKAQGIFCDRMGNLFVGDYANSRIHLLTSEGTFQRFVLGRESGLSRPVALAMTQSNKLVVVQSDGMVKIFSYEKMKVKVKVPCWCPRCVSNTEKANGNVEHEGHEDHGARRVSSH